MSLKLTGYDGFVYVSDADAKPLSKSELEEWHKGIYGNCQRCGHRYADLNPQCPNAHGAANRSRPMIPTTHRTEGRNGKLA